MRVSDDEVWEAWAATRRGGKAAGVDGVSIPAFRIGLEGRLSRIGRELRGRRYVPGRYREIAVPKPYGGTRRIVVANVVDRVVQRVLHNRLLPIVESISLPTSFAYRPGLSYRDAWRAISEHRAAGFTVVLDADVEKCFDRIPLALVRELLEAIGTDAELSELVMECIASGRSDAGTMGLPQGAVLSPVLCNLVLTELDRSLAVRHVRAVRYADDFVVMARSLGGLDGAGDRARHALWTLGLRLNEEKTDATDFSRGFYFLGAHFVGSSVLPGREPPYQRRMGRRRNTSPTRRKLAYVFG